MNIYFVKANFEKIGARQSGTFGGSNILEPGSNILEPLNFIFKILGRIEEGEL